MVRSCVVREFCRLVSRVSVDAYPTPIARLFDAYWTPIGRLEAIGVQSASGRRCDHVISSSLALNPSPAPLQGRLDQTSLGWNPLRESIDYLHESYSVY